MTAKKTLSLPRINATSEDVFLNRRRFVKSLSLIGTAMMVAPEARKIKAQDVRRMDPLVVPLSRPDIFPARRNPDFDPQNIKLTRRLLAAIHNNFYEFLPGRGGPVWQFTEKFKIEPWKVEVSGECNKPRIFDLDDLFKFEHEERIYHFRCVETWAMNIPWTGFPLRKLLEAVDPRSSAAHVQFITAHEPEEMPGLQEKHYPWPYFEALRMDEAMHDLAMLVTGVYGKPLLKQHGAPVRMIVPWKYGYKSPKSVVKIKLVREKPGTFWSAGPYRHEYGYLSNVNPNIPHPRWSQKWDHFLVPNATPRNGPRQPTQIFNGYAEMVANLYPNEPKTPQNALHPGQVAR